MLNGWEGGMQVRERVFTTIKVEEEPNEGSMVLKKT